MHLPFSSLTSCRIENYSILLASCAPVARLFIRTLDQSRRDGRPGYWSRSTDNNNRSNDTEMKRRPKDQWMESTATNWHDEENAPADWPMTTERSESRISRAQQPEHIDDGCVTVKTDIVVQVDHARQDRPLSISSGGARLLPEGGEAVHISENRRGTLEADMYI